MTLHIPAKKLIHLWLYHFLLHDIIHWKTATSNGSNNNYQRYLPRVGVAAILNNTFLHFVRVQRNYLCSSLNLVQLRLFKGADMPLQRIKQ